ncbi:MAG: hypothetical protein AAF387_08915 [Pseudomonadota bacterium]
MNKSQIINQHNLSFDPGDPKNGSLYLCEDPNHEPGTNVNLIIERLREAGCWSSQTPKTVPDEHRAAYEEQLQLIEFAEFRDADSPFIAARFDHEKFPSDDGRWQAWLQVLAQHYRRQ